MTIAKCQDSPLQEESPDPKKPLADPQREAFARAVARGVHRDKAYRMAGIGRARSAAWAMENRPEVEARIKVLELREERIAMAATAPTLAALVRLADCLQDATGPRAREARATLKLIGELRALVDHDTREAVAPPPPPAFTPLPQLTMQEWIDKYAHLGARWAEGSGPGSQ
ncbi:MAG TPA: hypothetical protein VGG92_21905 [Caulobacteraceae bacterium]|jgi:hypothetical protein